MHARVTKTERDPRGHTHELQDFHKERDTRAGRVAASYTLPTRLSEEIAARLHSTHSFVGEALPFQNSPGPPSCVLSITRAKTRQGTPGHTWAHLGTRKLSKAYSSRRGRGDTLIHTTHWNMEVPEEVMWPCHATLEVSQNSRPSMYERSRSCVHSAFECRPSVTLLHTPTVRGMFRRQTRGNAAVWSVEQSPSDRGDLGFEVTTRERRGSPQPVCVEHPCGLGSTRSMLASRTSVSAVSSTHRYTVSQARRRRFHGTSSSGLRLPVFRCCQSIRPGSLGGAAAREPADLVAAA